MRSIASEKSFYDCRYARNQRLATVSDVALANFSPGVLERLSMDYTSFQPARLGIIVASMLACGDTGPLRDMVTYMPPHPPCKLANLQGLVNIQVTRGPSCDAIALICFGFWLQRYAAYGNLAQPKIVRS